MGGYSSVLLGDEKPGKFPAGINLGLHIGLLMRSFLMNGSLPSMDPSPGWWGRRKVPAATSHSSDRNGSVQFSSVAQSCPTLCNPMNRSTLGLPVHHQIPEFTQTHVHWVGDAIQPSQPLSSPSPPAPNPSQHQSLFQWVNSSHEVAKVLEFQL